MSNASSAAGGARQWFKLTIAYDGSNYAGWQVQPGQTTIQGVLERALVKLVKVRVPVTGSGRTDSGVHAIGQAASLSLDRWPADEAALTRAINSQLPPDICVTATHRMRHDFHAIRDCTGKCYRYRLQAGGVRDPFEHRYLWHTRYRLDVAAMQAAAKLLVGKHDFACFQATGSDRASTVRDVRALTLNCDSGIEGAKRVTLEIAADGFLYNMVRNIVGTLVEIGRGRYDVDWLPKLIAARDRTQAGPTAPAHGLFLVRAEYPADAFFVDS